MFQVCSGAVPVLDLLGRICSVVRTFLPFFSPSGPIARDRWRTVFFPNGCVRMAQEE
uniref:Uncharacterized protein n=1 Tax=Siphoviridae sp. ctBLh2 TaxID=2827803 RepID=A0A8S5S408_9CAUD|nr:MAG TPA: hypothetical protein [Siphoviridae sp. ctBLh2]